LFYPIFLYIFEQNFKIMNTTHLHLILNHFPIIGSLIGFVILIYGLYTNTTSIQKLALYLFIALALISIPVYLSGDEAEETVEHISGISENTIHEHEEMAEKALVLMEILGVTSLFFFYNQKKQFLSDKILLKIIAVLSFITVFVFILTGNYGGKIRHSEITNTSKIIKYDDDDD